MLLQWLHRQGSISDSCQTQIAKRGTAEAIVASELGWARRTSQQEDGFRAASDHVYVRRTMVVWVDDHPQSVEPGDARHDPVPE